MVLDTLKQSDEDWKAHLQLPAKDLRYKTLDVTNTNGLSFEEMGLSRDLLKGIFEKGWENPSPIQEAAIGIALTGLFGIGIHFFIKHLQVKIFLRALRMELVCFFCYFTWFFNVNFTFLGKTGAFCVPMIEQIDVTKDVIQGLIVVPTRELALQTSQICMDLGKHLGLKVMVSTGGTDLRDDILRLNGTVHLVVATPGRIIDLMEKGIAEMGECGMLALG